MDKRGVQGTPKIETWMSGGGNPAVKGSVKLWQTQSDWIKFSSSIRAARRRHVPPPPLEVSVLSTRLKQEKSVKRPHASAREWDSLSKVLP